MKESWEYVSFKESGKVVRAFIRGNSSALVNDSAESRKLPTVLYIDRLMLRKHNKLLLRFLDYVNLCCPQNCIISFYDIIKKEWSPIDAKKISIFLGQTIKETKRQIKVFINLKLMAKWEFAGQELYMINPNVATKGVNTNPFILNMFPITATENLESILAENTTTEIMRNYDGHTKRFSTSKNYQRGGW